jgi:hypothetical protein
MSDMVAKKSFYVDAPVETVFDFISDPNRQREVALYDLHDVKVTKEGVGTQFTWSFKVAGLRFEGFEVFTDVVPNKHIAERSSVAMAGRWEYDFAPEGKGTRLTITLRPQSFWRFPPFDRLVGLVFARMSMAVMPKWVKAMEEAAASAPKTVPGQRKPASGKTRKPATSA